MVGDVVAQILKPSKISISLEFGLTIADRSKEMIHSKHLTVINVGIDNMLHVVSLFKDVVASLPRT